MTALELGIVSDEIAPDFREAIRHGIAWGITNYELRVLKSGRVPDVDPAEFEDVVQACREHALTITALSPGVFKHSLSSKAELERELREVLPATIAMARRCGARLIIVFGFQREKDEPPDRYAEAVAIMRRAAILALHDDLTLAIENEPGFWCDTGVNTSRLIRDVQSRFLRANWDPCNAFGTTEVPYPDGYEALKEFIVNVHAKDTLRGSLIQCVPVGDGVINWKGQIQALVRDRIVKHVTIETHSLPLVEQSAKNVRVLRSLISEATG